MIKLNKRIDQTTKITKRSGNTFLLDSISEIEINYNIIMWQNSPNIITVNSEKYFEEIHK